MIILKLRNLKIHKTNRNIYFSTVLLFHLLVLFARLDDPTRHSKHNTAVKNSEKKIKISFQNNVKKEDSKLKQIADSMNAKDQLKLNVKERFLSEKTNTFDRQTKAQIVDKFNIAGKGNIDSKESNQQKSVFEKKKSVSFKDLGVGSKSLDKLIKETKFSKEIKEQKVLSQFGQKNGLDHHRGLSSSNDFLQEIPLGDFTKLNTQEYKYYGFYQRIKQKLEQFWGRNIQEEVEKIYKKGRSLSSENNHITNLFIMMNEKGEILQVKVKSTSGVKELDQAAIDAFKQAGPFPNPPKGMLINGVATLNWGFVVNT